MTTVRKTVRRGFTQVENELLYRADMRGVEKWLVSYMLSKPDEWEFAVERITRETADGKHAVRAAMTACRAAGYVRLTCRKERGLNRFRYDVRAALDLEWPELEDGEWEVGPGDDVIRKPEDATSSEKRSTGHRTTGNRRTESKTLPPTLNQQDGKRPRAVSAEATAAQTIVTAWFDHSIKTQGCNPTAQPFPACIKVVEACLKAGYTVPEIKQALTKATTCSRGSLEVEIKRARQSHGTAPRDNGTLDYLMGKAAGQ